MYGDLLDLITGCEIWVVHRWLFPDRKAWNPGDVFSPQGWMSPWSQLGAGDLKDSSELPAGPCLCWNSEEFDFNFCDRTG